MTNADRTAFAQLIGDVYAFYRQEISEFALGVWWEAMAPLDLAAIRRALGQHTMNPDSGQFLPKPADVVKMLGGSTLDSALVAWSKLERALQGTGTYMTVVFDDALIHRVVDDMGGWTLLGRVTSRDWPFRQTEFLNRYRGYRMRGETPPYPAKLIGIFDGENSASGFKVDNTNVRLIGDARVALAVLKAGANLPLIGVRRIADVATPALIDLSEKAIG